MSENAFTDPWLVGGPGRCGKTYLVETLWEQKSRVAGFPLEGLFTVYARRWFLLTRRMREELVEEYVTRPRYTDVDRKVPVQPTRYFKSSPDELRAALPDNRRHPVEIVGWILDRFAKENECSSWASFDLHPEFRYASFRRKISGVKLAMMVRDAREAISAALYWRGDPGHGKSRDARFKHSLILFCLSVQTGRILARRWPQDVHIFDFKALVDGDETECGRVSQTFGFSLESVRNAYNFEPHFKFIQDRDFLLPDGTISTLLSKTELGEIALLTSSEKSYVAGKTRSRRGFLLLTRMVLLWGRYSPSGARAIADIVYYPRRTMTRRMNTTRQLAADMLRCLRYRTPQRRHAP